MNVIIYLDPESAFQPRSTPILQTPEAFWTGTELCGVCQPTSTAQELDRRSCTPAASKGIQCLGVVYFDEAVLEIHELELRNRRIHHNDLARVLC